MSMPCWLSVAADVNVTFLSLICARQSHIFAFFNVVFQPPIMADDQRMPPAHTGYITTAEGDMLDLRECPIL